MVALNILFIQVCYASCQIGDLTKFGVMKIANYEKNSVFRTTPGWFNGKKVWKGWCTCFCVIAVLFPTSKHKKCYNKIWGTFMDLHHQMTSLMRCRSDIIIGLTTIAMDEYNSWIYHAALQQVALIKWLAFLWHLWFNASVPHERCSAGQYSQNCIYPLLW